jgi:hypothetical protein
MSETILKILLSELTTLRFTCKCGGVAEVAIDKLDAATWDIHCPGCNTVLRYKQDPSRDLDGFSKLARAFRDLTAQSETKLQLVLPIKKEDESAGLAGVLPLSKAQRN